MRVLVACEESQEVCKAFRALGHEAYSCDIQECSGGHPEWHIKGNVLNYLEPWDDSEMHHLSFETMDGIYHDFTGQFFRDVWWDLIIAHPPCTYLTLAGNRWFKPEYKDRFPEREKQREEAIKFFMAFVHASCEKIAIENPIGVMSRRYRKPDQIIQPYQFGHPVRKSTCLWLKGLPLLNPTEIVSTEEDEHGFSIGGALRYAIDENGKSIAWNDPRTAKARSKTFTGIARAMAEQWGGLCDA